VVAALAAGTCYLFAGNTHPALLLWAIGLTIARMLLNTFDGVIAIQRGNLSLTGEIVNALPDRYSDAFVLAGVAISPLCHTWLGVAGMASVFLVSYTGMLGKALGVSWQHHGPLGKVERLIILMVFTLVQYIVLARGVTTQILGVASTPLEWCMVLFVVLAQVTVFNRLVGQLREIRRKEAVERLDGGRNRGRAIVVFDSATDNTRRAAEQIAAGLGCTSVHIASKPDISGCELVVLGSPNIRARQSAGMRHFQVDTSARPRRLAVFATYGMPVWGEISTPKCLDGMAEEWRMKPIARFSCKGVHVKYGTYGKRPNDTDLLGAFLFGLRLSKALERADRKERS
jgi:archaetidylinositol phosphate synthase